MRCTFGIIAVALVLSPAMAQNRPQDKTTKLPELNVHATRGSEAGGSSGSDAGRGCSNVQPGSTESLACLNRELQQQVNTLNPSNPSAPLSASSTDIKVGTVNMSAVKQQYGQNFGVSAVPYRPAMTFAPSPLHGR